jgi:protein SCO1/2
MALMKMLRRAGFALCAAALTLLAACDRFAATPAPSFKGVDITGAEYARSLSLPDTQGRMRSLDEFKGKVVVVFFGYTQCPDVCPTTMAELATLKRDLGADGQRVQGVFVTVDPERDTPEVLNAYMASFDPSFIALRGTPEQTKAAAQEFKVFYAKVPGKEKGSYSMDHTAGSYVFDKDGRLRLFIRHGGGADPIVHDIRQLLS